MLLPNEIMDLILKHRRRMLFQERIKKFEKLCHRYKEERGFTCRFGITQVVTPIGTYKVYPEKGRRKAVKQLYMKNMTIHFG